MRLRLVIPHQERISGGRIYNTEVSRALRRRGWEVEERPIRGRWPWPTPEERNNVYATLTALPRQPVLVDGLVGAACPHEIGAAVTAGIPVILLVHLPLPAETGLSAEEQSRLAELEREALAAATAVATISHWAAADLRRRYRLEDVHVLLPGASPAPIADGSEPPALLMLATFTPVKNHATALAALDLIGDLPWRAVLVGDHRDPEIVRAVRAHLRTSPHSQRIHLPGELTGGALDRVWHDTDLLLVPSWTETFGLVVTEALARGIPAIVSRGTGAEETLAGPGSSAGLAGAVADPADPREWAQILRTWLTDPVRRERWQARALQRREELRTWADTATDLDALLGWAARQ